MNGDSLERLLALAGDPWLDVFFFFFAFVADQKLWIILWQERQVGGGCEANTDRLENNNNNNNETKLKQCVLLGHRSYAKA